MSPRNLARILSHGLTVAGLLLLSNGCASTVQAAGRTATAYPPNLVGSIGLTVWGIDHQGEPALSFRWSGGAYAPTEANATSTRGTMLSHPYCRVTATEAPEIAAALRAWIDQRHNTVAWHTTDEGPMRLSFIGNDGVTWGPQYEPVLIVDLMWWYVDGRGETHGEMYVPLPVPQVEALADALEAWSNEPRVTKGPIYQTEVQ